MAEILDQARSWVAIANAAKAIVSVDATKFDPAIAGRVEAFVLQAQALCAPPGEVTKGYWNTVRFCWNGFEIEVFDDHLEAYHFLDGSTDIRQYAYSDDGALDPALAEQLQTLIA